MKKILFVDDDRILHRLFDERLKKYKDIFEIVHAENGREAIDKLQREDISLLVTDILMPEVDGLELLAHMNGEYPETPCIVLTTYTIPGLEENLSKKGVRFLQKPVKPSTLAQYILKGLKRENNGGIFNGLSVAGLMQLVESEQKTCLLDVGISGKRYGLLYFFEGELYDAVCGKYKGEEAALKLIAADDVQIRNRKISTSKISRRIRSSNQNLILKAIKLKDEKREEQVDRELVLFDEGIRLCARLSLNKAQKSLHAFIRKNPDHALGWLWLARTMSSMIKIKMALIEAHRRDTDNQEILQELKKVGGAYSVSPPAVHCPFCFAPINRKDTQCHYCRAYLTVNSSILSKIGEQVDRGELIGALKRFERVLSEELNIKVLFYAGLACLNLNDLDGALKYCEQLQVIAGKKSDYTIFIDRIVEFIASKQTTETGEQFRESDADKAADLSGSTGESMNGKKKTVLVVEDSPTTRKVIKMTLASNGFRVVEADDGVMALSRLNDENPDLIMLDVMLPKLDGYGILSILKKNKVLKNIPVLMLTSKTSLKDKLRGRFSSASAYLTKPFKPAELIAQVNQFI